MLNIEDRQLDIFCSFKYVDVLNSRNGFRGKVSINWSQKRNHEINGIDLIRQTPTFPNKP